jgi:rRNA maturation endonuclease Nob1
MNKPHISLGDVVNVLFAEYEKINSQALTGEKLTEQLDKTKAIVGISKQIIETAALALEAQKALPDMMHGATIPTLLRIDK